MKISFLQCHGPIHFWPVRSHRKCWCLCGTKYYGENWAPGKFVYIVLNGQYQRMRMGTILQRYFRAKRRITMLEKRLQNVGETS